MGKLLDDWVVGEKFTSQGRTITETDVVLFAALTGDNHQNHTNAEYMKNSQFGQRIAHGLLGLAMAQGLMIRLNIIDDNSIALLSVDDWNFKAPIFFGDTIHIDITVAEVRPSKSKPDRGILKLYFEVIKQDGTICQTGYKTLMMKRKVEN